MSASTCRYRRQEEADAEAGAPRLHPQGVARKV